MILVLSLRIEKLTITSFWQIVGVSISGCAAWILFDTNSFISIISSGMFQLKCTWKPISGLGNVYNTQSIPVLVVETGWLRWLSGKSSSIFCLFVFNKTKPKGYPLKINLVLIEISPLVMFCFVTCRQQCEPGCGVPGVHWIGCGPGVNPWLCWRAAWE